MMMDEEVNPLDTINHNIKQIKFFYDDIVELDNGEFLTDLEDLRDKCELLRSEFATLYSKMLDEL